LGGRKITYQFCSEIAISATCLDGGCAVYYVYHRYANVTTTAVRFGAYLISAGLWFLRCLATRRINSQAKALGIERPYLRNGKAIANQNTLIYILINLRMLQRIRNRQPEEN
jgi:hypothetical protein